MTQKKKSKVRKLSGNGKLKGTPVMNESMVAHAKQRFPEDVDVTTSNTMENRSKSTFNQEQAKKEQTKIANYNAKLTEYVDDPSTIDNEYSKLLPMRGAIVRAFHLEMEKEGKMLIPIKSVVVVPTQGGYGVHHVEDSPYQYDSLAVVIKVSKHLEGSLAPGQLIALRPEAVACRKQGKDAPFELALGFTHPRWRKQQPPTDIEHEDYGYLLVDPSQHATCVVEKK